jgi:hypothetical protein
MKRSSETTRVAQHGGGIRGADNQLRSASFEGRFGRLFRELPPALHSALALTALGKEMIAEPEQEDGKPAAARESLDRIQDPEENSGISAGYTYFGQFIDHDLTFDPASSLMQQNDPDALVNYRTPRLDLDSLYGRGPADQPYMYVGDKFRLGADLFERERISTAHDLPRYDDPISADPGPARALIGDKRNDENVIISQLHSAFLQLHNRFVDDFGGSGGKSFEEIQQMVRWHYQYVVVNDFLVKICGAPMIDSILPRRRDPSGNREDNTPKFQIYHWRNDAFIPLEFTVAAYRFGHSMVRPIYRLNTQLDGGDDPAQATPDERFRGIDGRFFIFAGVHRRALNGFGRFPVQWGIDWSLFFDINGSGERGGRERVQPAYKIDTKLVNPLAFLPEFSKIQDFKPPLTIAHLQPEPFSANEPANLATRNLLRGAAMNMPSGQAVARYMGLTPLSDDELRVGKAVVAEWKDSRRLVDVHPSFSNNAPLWYYILAEAQHQWFLRAEVSEDDKAPMTLGSVGGRIVAETIIGAIWNDPQSYLNQSPNWVPEIGGFDATVGALLKFALNLTPAA